MATLTMIAQLVLGLSILVFIHELGHFLAAKAFGMRVDKFYIFFDGWGKKLWSTTIGETEYGIGWLPLGGYVKIAGMIDESMDKDQLKQEPQEWEFRSKPAWQRFIVMIAGIVMNVILGVMIFSFVFMRYEKDYIQVNEPQEIYAFDLAEDMGLKTGDKLLAINGKTPGRFKDYKTFGIFFGADMKVERDGKVLDIPLTDGYFKRAGEWLFEPMKHQVEVLGVLDSSYADMAGLEAEDIIRKVNGKSVTNYGILKSELYSNKNGQVNIEVERAGASKVLTTKVDTAGKLGFAPKFNAKAANTLANYGVGDAVKYSMKEGWESVYYNALAIGKMFTGDINPVESVQSPIGIARKIYGGVWVWERFWKITGLLSFILAFMNILPIPALDGGHMMFILVELVIGRPLSDDFMEKAQMLGLMILLPLMLFAIGKDIIYAIFGW